MEYPLYQLGVGRGSEVGVDGTVLLAGLALGHVPKVDWQIKIIQKYIF